MKFEDKALLSFYEDITIIDNNSDVHLVRHIESNCLFIKKTISIYDKELYTTLKSLNVPGIPKIFLIAESDKELIVIEEYINGTTLEKYINDHGNFDEETAINIMKQICDILNFLHSLNPPIIHRDIKPSNIIISSNYNVTLIDFNAAKKYDENKSRDTILMGTADYAAPEQFGFGQSDARTDIYALGILLNIMLTGTTPKNKKYEGRLSTVISKCISIDPQKRYSSVKKLKKALFSTTINNFVPPGFRSRRIWKMILASLGYAYILYISYAIEVEDVNTASELFIYQVATFLILIFPIFIFANYIGISDILPLSRSRNTAIKMLGRLLWSAVSWLVVIFLAGIALWIFVPAQI